MNDTRVFKAETSPVWPAGKSLLGLERNLQCIAKSWEDAMFAPNIHVECVSIYEPTEGVWRDGDVKALTDDDTASQRDGDEEDFEAFCRRSLT